MPSNRTSAPSPSVRMLSAIAAGSSGSSRSATTPRRSPIAPPLTGGITASSSPSLSGSSHPAYSEFTAQRNDRGSGPRSYRVLSWLQASAAVAPAGSARSTFGCPTSSRRLAKSTTRTFMASLYWRSFGKLGNKQLLHPELTFEREPCHRPLGAAELRAGGGPGVDETGATDDLVSPAMRVAMDHHVVPSGPARPPVVQVMDHSDAPAADRPLDRRGVARVGRRVPIYDHDPPQLAQPFQDLLAAPVPRVPNLVDAREFAGHVPQERRDAEAALRVGDQPDLHRNRSVAGSRSSACTLPSPATDAPRIRATGTRSSLPITSSAAEASSSATPSSVPCSS